MSVRFKLVMIITFVAVVPLTVSAVSTLGIHQKSFDERLQELHVSTARYGAKAVQSYLDSAKKSLEKLIAGSIRWDALSPREKAGALWLIYGQLDSILAVSLLDQDGNGIGSSAYATDSISEYPGHPRATLEDLGRFGQSIPFDKAKAAGRALGAPFVANRGDAIYVPLAFLVSGESSAPRYVVAVAVSLSELCGVLEKERSKDTSISLLDEQGRYLCRAERPAGLSVAADSLKKLAVGGAEGTVRYADERKQDVLAAFAGTSNGWKVVVQQPAQSALAPSIRMREQSIFWIAVGIVAALAAGVFLAQGINKPIKSLAEGAGKIAGGDFAYRLEEQGRDEFGKLSKAFNHMCGEIEKRDTEIRAWNQELKERVEQRTRELKEAQNALLESRKMAAVASLGAGVAHEINNPLTGVIGLTQLLKQKARNEAKDGKDSQLLGEIEREALRIRDITEKMLRLSEGHVNTVYKKLKVTDILDTAIDAQKDRIADSPISIRRNYQPNLPLVLGSAQQLEEALSQILDNGIKAMARKGGRLEVSAAAVEGELVKLTVTDTGKGIKPEHLEKVFEPFFTTKDDWRGEGLGLALAYRIVQAHHGTIKLSSVVGEGTTVNITLPAARTGAHLE